MAQQKTILIVDDDEDLRGALAEQIDDEDEFTTLQAETARAGIASAQANRPDLILMDVDLPDLDGRQACAELRRDGVTAPIIMLTAKWHRWPSCWPAAFGRWRSIGPASAAGRHRGCHSLLTCTAVSSRLSWTRR